MVLNIEALIQNKSVLQELHGSYFGNKSIGIDVLRLDEIHPIASGNKIFKLQIPLQKALEKNCTTIITTGGFYSNHLVATAYIANALGLRSVGVIKAHDHALLTPTLNDCIAFGMELLFMKPSDFNNIEKLNNCIAGYSNSFWIDMGGYSIEGVEGCKQILKQVEREKYTHVITAVGTGTTMAGLCLSALRHQKILGISSMKKNVSLQLAVEKLLYNQPHAPFELIHDFHFGGFAKHSPVLIDFMNHLYENHKVPTDIVYTAKMFYGVYNLMEQNYFPNYSKLLIIHTGGLQGNRSLLSKSLLF